MARATQAPRARVVVRKNVKEIAVESCRVGNMEGVFFETIAQHLVQTKFLERQDP